MGLDIGVYTGPLIKVEGVTKASLGDEFWDRADDEGWLVPTCYNGFDRHAPLELEVPYKYKARYSFRAGSYSSFDRYRENLCQMAIGKPTEAIWKASEEYEGYAFFEQLQFGDNQDTIGPVVCVKLYNDYEAMKWAAKQAFMDTTDYYVYQEFLKAFKIAALSEGAINYE